MVVQRDRTNELYALFEGMKSAGGGEMQSASSTALIAAEGVPLQRHTGLHSSSEMQLFNRFAQAFSADLAKVSESIMRLTRLTQRQSVFEDQSSEITGLTQMVKSSLQRLQTDLETLEELKQRALIAQKTAAVKHNGGASAEQHSLWNSGGNVDAVLRTSSKHNDTVVDTLRTRLARTGQEFRTTLQQQTRAMKENTQRRHMFTASERMQTFESALFQDQERHQLQQQQLMSGTSNAQYYKQRAEAVRELEATVVEVSELFNDFSRLVHEQDEVVLRIDTDVDNALRHVNAGSNELMRYLANLSSNRGLILKIFSVLFFFILFFGLVVVR
ncbi:putative syntaxin 5 [Trypanosoma rangeli]|uniref:Putative syntaxin 5 n=1 Tax=Trypanosoma rangeli TaxID=5698 RepID=A0A3R7KH07_TRYRA|nr:putative syntaxin 5 [Trypanosoma rangeli]RNF07494.1 putative syntaxin 5 [Trypanosoma rangeli]|eukprot:RNF07494.1 putative syntaxin 5 [Trypanosoma rangeli]